MAPPLANLALLTSSPWHKTSIATAILESTGEEVGCAVNACNIKSHTPLPPSLILFASSLPSDATAMAPARWMVVSAGYFWIAVMTHSMAPLVTSFRVFPLCTLSFLRFTAREKMARQA